MFDVDDQTPEDLAIALERLRATTGVLDVSQASLLGKKGRLLCAIRVLSTPAALELVIATCFDETTTIGVRQRLERRAVLRRVETQVDAHDPDALPDASEVKLVLRPGGQRTAKAGADDVARVPGGHAERQAARRAAEDATLSGEEREP